MTNTNQGLQQASVRAVTGTTGTYNDDWMALFALDGITQTNFDGALLNWINDKLSASYTFLPNAMQAFAVNQGFSNWTQMGTFDATGGTTSRFLLADGTSKFILADGTSEFVLI